MKIMYDIKADNLYTIVIYWLPHDGAFVKKLAVFCN